MAPHGEAIPSTYTRTNHFCKQPKLSSDNLHRTISDISFELSKDGMGDIVKLPPISEVEDAKCECCGLSEECTPEYVDRVRGRFLGKWICGLCAEAVKEEMEKNRGMTMEDALSAHTSTCARFNKLGRGYPVLMQAEAMREIFKKSTKRSQSMSPKGAERKVCGIARSSSCMPAITREMQGLTLAN